MAHTGIKLYLHMTKLHRQALALLPQESLIQLHLEHRLPEGVICQAHLLMTVSLYIEHSDC